MKIRVLLVEDQKIMQKYFASMVQGDERFLLVDVLNDGEKAVSYCNHTVVDLVLMDVQTFQNHDGLLAAETIKKPTSGSEDHRDHISGGSGDPCTGKREGCRQSVV